MLQAVPNVVAALACFERIQNYLDKDAREDFRCSPTTATFPLEDEKDEFGLHPPDYEKLPMITISGGNFGWNNNTTSLSNIDLAIPKGQLTMVIGPVASGKSTLCKVLLGEALSVCDGEVMLGSQSRRIGYCDQTPFLTNGTIRQNIVGFSSYDRHRYNMVIEATMLTPDLLNFPRGDETRVGSNGISLSGGQKQRVSMARALYLGTDFFIFDDVLSGLDADTEDQVFRRVFGPEGMIRKSKATVILCTHSIRHLPSANHIIAVSPGGEILEQGTFAQLVANKDYVYGLGVKARDSNTKLTDTSFNSQKTVEVTTPLALLQPSTTTGENHTVEEVETLPTSHDRTVYMHYYHSIGFWPMISFVFTALLEGFLHNWQTIWVDIWSNGVTGSHPTHSNAFYLCLFALFQVLGLIFLPLNVWICLGWILPRAGSSLHKAALNTVITAPLRFFTTTDNGSVTNLFSQDMTLIDGELPIALINTALCAAIALFMAGVIATSAPYLVITYPFLALILWMIQRFYLRTSRQLRILDLDAKSPL